MSFSFRAARMLLLIAVLLLPSAYVFAQQSEPREPAAPAKTDLDTMQPIENIWSQALLKHDQYAFESVLAAGFVDISADGEVTTRNQQIARLFLKDTEPISFDQKVASVRLFGDIAVVNGTYVLRYSRDGHTIDDKGIFSHVFQKTRTHWQCINSQRTFVVEQGAANRKPGALPFHLPGTRPATTTKKPPPDPTQQQQPPAIPGPQQ